MFALQRPLEPFLDQATAEAADILLTLVSSASEIALSLQHSPASDASAFNGMRAFVSNCAGK